MKEKYKDQDEEDRELMKEILQVIYISIVVNSHSIPYFWENWEVCISVIDYKSNKVLAYYQRFVDVCDLDYIQRVYERTVNVRYTQVQNTSFSEQYLNINWDIN